MSLLHLSALPRELSGSQARVAFVGGRDWWAKAFGAMQALIATGTLVPLPVIVIDLEPSPANSHAKSAPRSCASRRGGCTCEKECIRVSSLYG